MLPELFSIGPISIYSYGAMLACAFLVGTWLFRGELRRWSLQAEVADRVAIAAMVGGVLGAKIYFVVLEAPAEFAAAPFATLFSGAGLTFYGGLAGAVIAIWLVLRRTTLPFVHAADLLGPILILGYAFGRMGCLLSGDGDYGPPTDLPWGMSFPNGTVPTVVSVHPTPVYEVLLSLVGFAFLWFFLRHKALAPGVMIAATFLVAGIQRFIAEFWRFDSAVYGAHAYSFSGASQEATQRAAFDLAVRAHFVYAGLSLAQVLSVALFIAGIVILIAQRNAAPRVLPTRLHQRAATAARPTKGS